MSATSSEAPAVFVEKVRQSNLACQSGDFDRAVKLYTEALALEPANHILYSNRSAAYIKMGQFAKALQDAVRAKELSPEWPKVRHVFHINNGDRVSRFKFPKNTKLFNKNTKIPKAGKKLNQYFTY